MKQREVEFDARSRLKSDSYVSQVQLQEAVALLETARAELTRAELDLAYMSVRAPFAGALQARMVEIGDFVKRGDPVATYVDNRTIIVSANLSEFDAKYVDVGDPAVGKARNLIDHYRCPRCGGEMNRLVDPIQTHIWYEECEDCHGAYFDAGEFKDLATVSLADFFKRWTTPARS